MRRLITVITLIIGLLVATATLGSQSDQLPPMIGRVDRNNNVICYSITRQSEHLSCVHIPRDGVQVNVPKPNGESRT